MICNMCLFLRTCNDHEGKANEADDLEADNSRISAMIRKRENEMEEVRDEFKNERNAFRERQKKAKQEIKDLSMVAGKLQFCRMTWLLFASFGSPNVVLFSNHN